MADRKYTPKKFLSLPAVLDKINKETGSKLTWEAEIEKMDHGELVAHFQNVLKEFSDFTNLKWSAAEDGPLKEILIRTMSAYLAIQLESDEVVSKSISPAEFKQFLKWKKEEAYKKKQA